MKEEPVRTSRVQHLLQNYFIDNITWIGTLINQLAYNATVTNYRPSEEAAEDMIQDHGES